MNERAIDISKRTWSRIAGVALLAIIVFGLSGSVFGDAGGSRYRIGPACEFAMLNCDILLAVALYALLEGLNGPLALLGAFWRFGNAAVLAVGVAAELTALRAPAASHHANAFGTLHDVASPIGLLLWSLGAVVHSYLLYVSRYVPRVLSGAYFVVAAIIFVGCFATLVSPALSSAIGYAFVWPDLPVELAVGLWLAVKGANVSRGPSRARASDARSG